MLSMAFNNLLVLGMDGLVCCFIAYSPYDSARLVCHNYTPLVPLLVDVADMFVTSYDYAAMNEVNLFVTFLVSNLLLLLRDIFYLVAC